MTEENNIESIKKQAEEYLNGWKRAKADYLNLKKEMEAQNKEIKEWLSKIFLMPLLEIMDSFNKAFGNVPANLKTEVWVEGIEGIKKQFEDFLKAQGVEAMEVIGEKFDPLRQEAIESANGGESGRIIEELQKGYLIGGEVLRPAKVKVYK
ncbi:MAG: nucleotide exchange factor GrpE [Candidatus Azambacteria bacterium]|nr:nucleotide exchange factor GrpE [Candidatus Azambacteria bacterium]